MISVKYCNDSKCPKCMTPDGHGARYAQRHEGFTPGVWEATGRSVYATWRDDSGERVREIVYDSHNTRSGEVSEQKANARLIADAPNLLAENQRLRALLKSF